MTQTRTRLVSALAMLLGVVMIAGGAAKLASVPSQVVAFAGWGLPAWFRDLVGTFEIFGGILLVLAATRPAGSLILSTIMVGALWAHAANGEWPHLVPVAILLSLFLTIFGVNRAQARRLLGGR